MQGTHHSMPRMLGAGVLCVRAYGTTAPVKKTAGLLIALLLYYLTINSPSTRTLDARIKPTRIYGCSSKGYGDRRCTPSNRTVTKLIEMNRFTQQFTDWYGVSRREVQRRGGGSLFNYFPSLGV